MTDSWVLLAEDDKLFTALFSRFWKARFPEVPLIAVCSMEAARREMQHRSEPEIAIVDLTLEDGTTEEFFSELRCEKLLWSACAEGHIQSKPSGREELEAAVVRVGVQAGLLLPPNRGSTLEEKE